MDLLRFLPPAKPGAGAFRSDSGGACADDEGPFFDLDFTDVARRGENNRRQQDSDDEEFDFEMPPGCDSGLCREASLAIAPFRGAFDSAKSAPGFLVKSANRIRSFHLGLRRKPKSSSASADLAPAPPVSFFVRDRSSGSSRSARFYDDDCLPATDERKLPGDVLRRYLDRIRPLYDRISERYGERLHFSCPLGSGGAGKVRPAVEGDADGQLEKEKASAAAETWVASRRLRKSRSASAAGKRDDSLLEQQDGIQSAIAHCKRSLNR